MQWTSDYIRVWFFARGTIPSDITNQAPNPSSWGLPAAEFQGSCVIDQKFQAHKIIMNNAFCGEYAGAASVWNSSTNSCAASTNYSTCNAYVAGQPAAFQNACVECFRFVVLIDTAADTGASSQSESINLQIQVRMLPRLHTLPAYSPRQRLVVQVRHQHRRPRHHFAPDITLPSSNPAHSSTKSNAVSTLGGLTLVPRTQDTQSIPLRTVLADAATGTPTLLLIYAAPWHTRSAIKLAIGNDLLEVPLSTRRLMVLDLFTTPIRRLLTIQGVRLLRRAVVEPMCRRLRRRTHTSILRSHRLPATRW